MLDRFGSGAVFGGEAPPGMLRKMAFCERVVMAHAARSGSDDWATWAMQHKADNDLLNWCIKVANGK